MKQEMTLEYVIYAYKELNKSTYEIAAELDTYPNRIRRMLDKANVGRRDKGEAQKQALKSGRHKHPTKGTERPESVRIKISEGMGKVWETMSSDEKNRRVTIAKEKWEGLAPSKKERFRKLAAEAVREAAEHGSKLERYLLVELQRNGFKVDFHREQMVANERLQMDLYVPLLNTVIEIDGPAHFFPIWGEENLAKHISADHEKNGLLIQNGFCIIRVKHLIKTISEIHKRRLLKKVIDVLQSIHTQFPDENSRLIEVEVD